jgi:hypothetical protein
MLKLKMLAVESKQELFGLVGMITLCFICFCTLGAMSGQKRLTSNQSSKDNKTPLPIVDYQNSAHSVDGAMSIRTARGKRHDNSPMNVRELPSNVDQLPINQTFWWGIPSIPALQSDAVIVGEVTSAQAYLSDDKTGVYSEFIVRVEKVLKTSVSANLTAIAVERPGGAVRFPSGRIVRYEIHQLGMPIVGNRYLLFLRYHGDGDDFDVLTGYLMRKGRIKPLDQVEGIFDEYNDWSESAFQDLVFSIISRGH